MTPGDLRNQRFRRAFGGFAAADVNALIEAVVDRWEQTLQGTEQLRLEAARLEGVVHDQQRGLEAAAGEVQALNEMTAKANEAAERLIEDARGRCDAIDAETGRRLHELCVEIERLRIERRDVAMEIEQGIQALHTALGVIREQNTRERDRPQRAAGASAGDPAAVAALQELDDLSEDIIRSLGLPKDMTDGS